MRCELGLVGEAGFACGVARPHSGVALLADGISAESDQASSPSGMTMRGVTKTSNSLRLSLTSSFRNIAPSSGIL